METSKEPRIETSAMNTALSNESFEAWGGM